MSFQQPEMTVAAMLGAPMNISIIVKKDSPVTTLAQLKGKTVSAGPNPGVPRALVFIELQGSDSAAAGFWETYLARREECRR